MKARLAKFFYTSSSASLEDGSSSNCSTQISSSKARTNFFGSVAAFPWRHSPDPLPRLCLPDSSGIYEPAGPRGFAGLRSDSISRFIIQVWAARLMNVSWLEIVLAPKSWETCLANNCAVAFRTCLGCLFSNIFCVPLQSIVLKGETNFGCDPLISYDSDAYHKNHSNMHSQAYGDINVDDELDVINDATLLQMLDSKLLDLYQQQSKSSKPALSVLLQMQVLSAKLENLHAIPLLTREIVQHNPGLRGSIQEIITNTVIKNQVQQKSFLETIHNATEELEALAQKIISCTNDSCADGSSFSDADENVIAYTIVAQITIFCKEKFRTIDVLTGECVQGDRNANERIVPHLIRFERVTKYNTEKRQYFLGQWKITDWDDLLDGNIWY